jgi:flagellar motor switch protein FliN/FliY
MDDASESKSIKGEPNRRHGSTPPPVSVGDDIQVLLEQAERAISSINDPAPKAAGVRPFQLAELAGTPPNQEKASLSLLRDVELELKIELGRSRMPIEDLMKLRKGSVVPLDKMAGDPVDVFVNGRLVARGEVLVFNDNFCVRVAELVSGDQS